MSKKSQDKTSSDCLQSLPSAVARLARVSARHLARTLCIGESGTGKGYTVKLIHALSPRRDKQLWELNCPGTPKDLLESKLWGHLKGSFSGAVRDQRGLFAEAHLATLHLNELGEFSLEHQAKLLTSLELEDVIRYTPIGANKPERSDIHLLMSTNLDLPEAIHQGRFREDLCYRIAAGIVIYHPPLRERREEIPIIVNRFLQERSVRMSEIISRPFIVKQDAMRFLKEGYKWPGNIRELLAVLTRLVHQVEDPVIRASQCEDSIKMGRLITGRGSGQAQRAPNSGGPFRSETGRSRKNYVRRVSREVERRRVIDALSKYGWSAMGISRACKELGMGQSTLRNRIKEYGLRPPNEASESRKAVD